MFGGRTPEWETRDGHECCSYCGSLSPEVVLAALRTPGTKFSGTDKIGYKVYVDVDGYRGKFYLRHARALDDDGLAQFSATFRRVFGWSIERDEKGAQYCRAPQVVGFFGFQTWGRIGDDGAPVFDEHSPKAPADAWWEK